MMRTRSLVLLALLPGCDYSADFLFTGPIDGVDDVLVIPAEDGEQYLTPVPITSMADVRANTIYTEVSQSTTARLGGATLEFLGTGDSVCVYVDPEAVFWSAAVSPSPSDLGRQYSYPDNPFDDGDIDLSGGLSVFYTGSPDELMGDFVVFYEDELGNEVPIGLEECVGATGGLLDADTSAGKGSAEFCTFSNTQVGVAYTVALTAWSVPLDDDRLSFGVLLAEGPCTDILALAANEFQQAVVNSNETQLRECIIPGESLRPEDAGPHYGFPEGLTWDRFEDVEAAYCRFQNAPRLDSFCLDEASSKADDDLRCSWDVVESDDDRCYCGDINDLPNPGAG